ncbi:MAG: 1-deoxy-D-xylulose-5-phosphate synthase [Spirochaetes bacterium]|nr:1-deoxy-D-xylulose-5-phosphate synthase [Spirochaetota bacterium]
MKSILETINSPADLKQHPLSDLPPLAEEIRTFIIHNLAKTGGHLASNLGVVELTLMLHYVFDSPKDRIIFDVGHQTYTHKIITGRRGRFHTMRTTKGLSGFPRRSESEHDIADTGHASTSISIGLGIDIARRIQHQDGRVIAVIGDGSITGGLALEAINNAGHMPNNLIIVVNNNEMSIGGNIGAFSKYLNKKINAPGMQALAGSVESALLKLPFGEKAKDFVKRFESSVKAFIAPGIVFRELGFKYLGPVDGHNIEDLNATFTLAKTINEPLLIQVNTKKGKGYAHSENDPSSYHGIGEFDVTTGKAMKKKGRTFSALFGDTISEHARKDEAIVAVTAAMCEGTGLGPFAKEFPARCFDVGIAEGHALTFAAGLALGGLKPVVAVYSTFLQRAYDSVIHDIAIMKLPVIIAIDRAGIVPEDGETHQGIFDLAFLRIVPNIEIYAPSGEADFKKIFALALSRTCPVAIRYPKDAVPALPDTFFPETIAPGKAHTVMTGKQGVVFTFGSTLAACYTAMQDVHKDIPLTLVNLISLKPLDEEAVVAAAKKYKRVMIVEEGVTAGGIGSAVLEILAKHGVQVPARILGVPNMFVETGSREALIKRFSLDRDGIKKELRSFFTRRMRFTPWR